MERSQEFIARLERIERDAWESMCRAAPKVVAEAIGLEGFHLGEAFLTLCRRIDQAQFNKIIGLGLDGSVPNPAMPRAVDQFKAASMKNGAVQIPLGQAGLEDQAKALGLKPSPRSWIKFDRPTAKPPLVETALRIEPVGQRHEEFGAVVAAGFGMPPLLAKWLAVLPSLQSWHAYLAFDGDKPVSGAALYRNGDLGWLGVSATKPEGRRNGAQSALLAHRISEAGKMGCGTVTVETGLPLSGEPFPSFANILRAGFRVSYERRNWVLPAA